MQRRTIFNMAAACVMALGLSACAGGFGSGGLGIGGFGGNRMAYNSGFDRYYGDPLGYRAVPYGYAGSNFGWSGRYYYPGTGNYVFDRSGRQRQWSRSQQRHWQNRIQRQNRMQQPNRRRR